MGTIFEELIRRFNEENNEEAGEHFTPRDVVELMAYLIFMPVADDIQSGTYPVYDGACGTGGMLTVAEETLIKLATDHGKEVSVHLYGQEVNPETFAISKADLILKGEGVEAENMKFGSTLSVDAFPSREFDFMLSNPPYGKSWKTDLEHIGGKKDIRDPRFVIEHGGDPEFSLVTRSSDGQMVFLANMLSKMKKASPLGSRIAEVHNGSSLFTGDADSGESNVRRWAIENDWLEAIIALPLNIFYNTGIATYIWVLSNRKVENRRGKVQLVDATSLFKPLRKNLGKKNCALGPDDIKRICDAFLQQQESESSKIFPNDAFGYWKVTVERPLRLKAELTDGALRRFRKACSEDGESELASAVEAIAQKVGPGPHLIRNPPDPVLFETLERKLVRFAAHNMAKIAQERPALPEALDDRAQDNWELLLAIADTVGGHWPQKAREAALALSGAKDEPTSLGEELLRDIYDILAEKDAAHARGNVTEIASGELVDALVDRKDRPWGECNRGKPITRAWLAKRLNDFGIKSKKVRVEDLLGGTKPLQGYERKKFDEAFSRYLSPKTPLQSGTPEQENKINDLDENQSGTPADDVPFSESRNQLKTKHCSGVPLADPGAHKAHADNEDNDPPPERNQPRGFATRQPWQAKI
jgi:type I restriction-modification system DNA methylase subunit